MSDDQKAEIRRTFATWLGLFVPFTPIAKEGGLTRAPMAVIALIVVNVSVHLFAWPAEQADQRLMTVRASELAEIELGIEQRWLGAAGGPLSGWSLSSRLRGRNAFEKTFWESFEQGRIIDRGEPLYLDWRRANARWLEAKTTRLFYHWGTHPENGNPLSWLTAMFLHAGFWHLFGNMFFLWVAGSTLEEVWGPRFLLLLYLSAGLLAQVPDALFLAPKDIPGVGASGAVAGLMGAFLVKMHAQKLRFIILPMLPTVLLPGWVFFLPWGFFELRNALSGQFTGIAHWVHVGGFLGGGLVAFAFRLGRAEDHARVELARTDAKAVARKRAMLEERAAANLERGDAKGALADLIEACETQPGAHASFGPALERLVLAGERERATALALMTLQVLWQESRKEEHAAAFAIQRDLGLSATLPSIEILHGADSLAIASPRDAALTLHTFLTARPEDPLAKAAMNRYADLLERLGQPEAAADARVRAAAIKSQRD